MYAASLWEIVQELPCSPDCGCTLQVARVTLPKILSSIQNPSVSQEQNTGPLWQRRSSNLSTSGLPSQCTVAEERGLPSLSLIKKWRSSWEYPGCKLEQVNQPPLLFLRHWKTGACMIKSWWCASIQLRQIPVTTMEPPCCWKRRLADICFFVTSWHHVHKFVIKKTFFMCMEPFQGLKSPSSTSHESTR